MDRPHFEPKLSMLRGIYLVANERSEAQCVNLVYSIRKSGCKLPIRLIPFGGRPVRDQKLLAEVEVVEVSSFPEAARQFIDELAEVLSDCPRGFLYRFLSWFGDWDEFIYSDNDVVALMNWEHLFDKLPEQSIVHADEEYTTKGRFNYDRPDIIEEIFGDGALLSAVTAGHFATHRDSNMVDHMRLTITWFKNNPGIAKKHDQAFLHLAALIGNWKILNLCRPPHEWLSSWAGDYGNTLSVIHAIQSDSARKISHLHFSGGAPIGTEPTADLLHSHLDSNQRTRKLTWLGFLQHCGWFSMHSLKKRIQRGIVRRWKS